MLRSGLKYSIKRLDDVLGDKKLTLYITNPEYGVDKKTGECSEEHQVMNQVIEASKTLSTMRIIYLSFKDIFKQKDTDLLDRWLKQYKPSYLQEMASFTAGIEKDIDAVKNAIIYDDISNGPIEGLNNKLKAIKRQMYGRAGYRLLMLKMYLSKTG